MESFFGSLKTELVHRTRFRARREARAALFEYMEIFYNQRRRHSSIGYRTPAQARRDMTIAQAALVKNHLVRILGATSLSYQRQAQRRQNHE